LKHSEEKKKTGADGKAKEEKKPVPDKVTKLL
jgi:hypothetical protein